MAQPDRNPIARAIWLHILAESPDTGTVFPVSVVVTNGDGRSELGVGSGLPPVGETVGVGETSIGTVGLGVGEAVGVSVGTGVDVDGATPVGCGVEGDVALGMAMDGCAVGLVCMGVVSVGVGEAGP
jgi:hypothetical protein